MEVPTEILVLLSNTQSLDQALRSTAEERLKFFEQNELGKLDPLSATQFAHASRIPSSPDFNSGRPEERSTTATSNYFD